MMQDTHEASKSPYKLTVGLEIHAELNTKTKMFCRCLNDPDQKEPNVNVCPICMGHPGTLPTINKEAVRSLLKVGAAVDGILADYSEFDRKNYFYPDIPKGYQISQYKYPLVSGGTLRGIGLTRIHLEEDTAKSSHEGTDGSLIDYNRSSLPLLELVTEPVIHSAKDAGDFAKELQLLFRTLGVAEANMEKGEMRVEANISVSKDEKFGIKVEVKNLNSFRSVERAIDFEVARHIELLEEGKEIVQETRGWDENKQQTFSQRKKENSHDYRYFPDPDLPKMKLSEIKEFSKEVLLEGMPELPWKKRERLQNDFDLTEKEVELLVETPILLSYLEKTASALSNDKASVRLATNYLLSDIIALGENFIGLEKISPEHFAELISMLVKKELSSRAGKDILKIMFTTLASPKSSEAGPREIAIEHDLLQKNDEGALEKMLREIIDANPNVVADYKAGKASALMFFVGQVMKASKGSANPELAKTIAEKILNG